MQKVRDSILHYKVIKLLSLTTRRRYADFCQSSFWTFQTAKLRWYSQQFEDNTSPDCLETYRTKVYIFPKRCFIGTKMFPIFTFVRIGWQTSKDLWAKSKATLIHRVISLFVNVLSSSAVARFCRNDWEMYRFISLCIPIIVRPTKDQDQGQGAEKPCWCHHISAGQVN